MKKLSVRFFSWLLVVYIIYGLSDRSGVVSKAEKMAAPGVCTVWVQESTDQKGLPNLIYQFLLPAGKYATMKQKTVYTEDQATSLLLLEQKSTKKSTETKTTAGASDAIAMEKLENYEYLLGHFYTVDSVTYADSDLINAKKMLAKDMKLKSGKTGYQVLIFHTHSQEAFRDSKKEDPSTTIVGMGAYLAKLLEQKQIKTLHHDGVYDLIDGKLDRSKAYELAEDGVRKILKENEDIEVVIDLHRDGVSESTRLVTDIEGKSTAKIMFFNGLSRTKQNGEIAYLQNPYLEDNLAFSFQMQLACEKLYPGFARHIYLKGYRYSLHMMPKSLLIEAGAQNNTVEEMKNAMELLADVLAKVLNGGA